MPPDAQPPRDGQADPGQSDEQVRAHRERLLVECDFEVVGQLTDASNGTLFVRLRGAGEGHAAVHKPEVGERPLWDFPTGGLYRREVATYRLARALGFDRVPPTVLREDGPYGPGSLQWWVGPEPGQPVDPGAGVVDVVTPRELPDGWRAVLRARDGTGRHVVLCHADAPELAEMAVLDILANNADRKGGHVLRDHAGRLFGVDHGLTFHHHPKLRTVLWGWAGEPVPEPLLDAVAAAHRQLDGGELGEHLAGLLTVREELDALGERFTTLLRGRRFPGPSGDGPAIPWPAF